MDMYKTFFPEVILEKAQEFLVSIRVFLNFAIHFDLAICMLVCS